MLDGVKGFVGRLTEPVLAPVRRVVPPVGPLDLSALTRTIGRHPDYLLRVPPVFRVAGEAMDVRGGTSPSLMFQHLFSVPGARCGHAYQESGIR